MTNRYLSQKNLPIIGDLGQEKLTQSNVVCIGAGGIASSLLYCLCGAGVGNITLIDYDTVSLSNLNRQFIHKEQNIGLAKAESAKKTLSEFNSEINITAIHEEITNENINSFIKSKDLVLCCVDNLKTRLIINKAAKRENIPLINGGIDGYFATIQCVYNQSACLECIYNGADSIIKKDIISFAPVVSVISSMMAQCALDFLLSGKMPLYNQLLIYDAHDLSVKKIDIQPNKNCPVCFY